MMINSLYIAPSLDHRFGTRTHIHVPLKYVHCILE